MDLEFKQLDVVRCHPGQFDYAVLFFCFYFSAVRFLESRFFMVSGVCWGRRCKSHVSCGEMVKLFNITRALSIDMVKL